MHQHLCTCGRSSVSNDLASVSCRIADAVFTRLCHFGYSKALCILLLVMLRVASCRCMALEGLGQAPGQPAEVQLVSLLACFEELLIECLGARSTFIRGQNECMAGDGVLKVPAEAARAWIRGMLSTPDQLRALDTNSLIRRLKVRYILYGMIGCCW